MHAQASKAILRQRSIITSSTARNSNHSHHHHHHHHHHNRHNHQQQQQQNHHQQFDSSSSSSSNLLVHQLRAASFTETMSDNNSLTTSSNMQDLQSTDGNMTRSTNENSECADNTTTTTTTYVSSTSVSPSAENTTLSTSQNSESTENTTIATYPPSSGSLSTSMASTETATAAAATAPPPPVPAADALLRDWSTGSQPPIVAPAVVLNETSDSSQNPPGQQPKTYSYPVATYVSNFVRSSVNEIRNHIADVGHVMAIPEENVVSSIRSEPPQIAAGSGAAAAASASTNNNESAITETARSLNMLDNEDDHAEPTFLIDGEMLILEPRHHMHHHPRHRHHHEQHHHHHPRHPSHHEENQDENDLLSAASSAMSQDHHYYSSHHHHAEMDFYNQQDRTSCRSSRMRRSVKGLKKWVGKGKKIIKKSVSKQHLKRDGSGRSLATTDSELGNSQISCSTRQDDETPSTGTGSYSPSRKDKKHKKKKNRLTWLRDIERSHNEEATAEPPSRITASAPPALPAEPTRAVSPQHQHLQHEAQQEQQQMQLQQQPSRASSPPFASLPDLVTIAPSPPDVAVAPTDDTAEAAAVAEASVDHDSSMTFDTSSYGLLGSPDQHPSFHRQASIAAEASFVGNADTLYLEAGVLPDSVAAEAYIEDRIDEYDKYDEDNVKKDGGYYPRSMVPANADFKVDKQDAPCVDSMLRRAGEFAREISTESEPSVTESVKTAALGKSEGQSVPLSMATSKDELVHNDVLKLVTVGDSTVDKAGIARALRKSSKKARKRTTLAVDVHSWTPPNEDGVKFTIWDVQGANSTPYSANFGAHPGTQSLFFSDRGLYLLVWDLAADNPRTFRADARENDSDSDSDEEEDNEFFREEANRQADRALQTDIEDRVLSWVDCIARRGPNSAILPVALVPQTMSPEEAKRRCDIMQTLLMEHTDRKLPGDLVAPKVLSGVDTVICVSLETNMGMDQLQETVVAIATDASHSVFDHVGTPVPQGAVAILETIRRLKQNHKLVLVDHIMAENDHLSVEAVMDALHFLASIGEVLYFGGMDEVLSQYVILSRKWLVSALSCILRNDLKKELCETRRFMNMQCLYGDQQFHENPVVAAFSASHSTCPLLSTLDTQMLWQSMSFMREAADQTAQLNENSTTTLTMFGFLQHLLVHTGVFVPLDVDRFASPDNVYFVPSLLAQIPDSREVWTFKSSESWMTTLSHSWLFRDGAPAGLMERVTSSLLRDLYEFSHVVPKPTHGGLPPRSNTFPLGHSSMTQFMDNHEGDAIGHIKIHQIMCWKSSLLIKIGCVFSDGSELRESFVEIFVAVTDQSSPHCVASDAMRANMQRLVVSGKGQVGHHGRKLWKGGYGIVLDSIKMSVADCTNVDRQVVCPECLSQSYPSSASTWSWDSVRAAAESCSAVVRCMRGHRADTNLICGSVKPALPKAEHAGLSGDPPKKPVRELLPSVVVVGLYDPISKNIVTVGSGFVANKKLGLIITAGHIIFQMKEGPDFGMPFCGSRNPKAVIGVINPDSGSSDIAVFRYFAECVADDVHSVDACVLRITTRLENDVSEEDMVGEQTEIVVTDPLNEQLQGLKMTSRYELEETVRVLGFNQGGEGILERGKHVNRSADFAKGYICKQFIMNDDNSTTSSSDDSSTSSCGNGFSPREEIVVMVPTISGHSGGPCVNDEGKVVGILSRADPVDRQRCYLVPTSELKILMNKAKNQTSRRVGDLKMH